MSALASDVISRLGRHRFVITTCGAPLLANLEILQLRKSVPWSIVLPLQTIAEWMPRTGATNWMPNDASWRARGGSPLTPHGALPCRTRRAAPSCTCRRGGNAQLDAARLDIGAFLTSASAGACGGIHPPAARGSCDCKAAARGAPRGHGGGWQGCDFTRRCPFKKSGQDVARLDLLSARTTNRGKGGCSASDADIRRRG